MRSLATKEGRLQVQQYQFESLTNKGYNREIYGDLNIFTMTDDVSTWLKIYRGTAAKEIVFKRYRTAEQAAKEIDNQKRLHDRNKAYKAELKANPTKSSHANCAKAIREELKKAFPDVKFSVKSDSFSGGDAVRISWADGPTDEMIRDIVRKYQYGSFNGMEDMYEYTNSREDIPQTKYVQTSRNISEEVNKVVFDFVKEFWNPANIDDLSQWEIDREINNLKYTAISNTPIPLGAVIVGVGFDDDNRGFKDLRLKLQLPETTTAKTTEEKPSFEPLGVKTGEVNLIDYSEKSFAVVGDTKPIKDKLKELGGKFNFRLSCGAGWIFPKTKLTEVQALFAE